MAELKLPGDDEKKKFSVSRNRVVVWIAVGGFAVYMIVSGIVGILTKAR